MRVTPTFLRMAALLLAAGVLAHALASGRVVGALAAACALAVQVWWLVRTRIPIRTGAARRAKLRIGSGGGRHG